MALSDDGALIIVNNSGSQPVPVSGSMTTNAATSSISTSGPIVEATSVSATGSAATTVNFAQTVREFWVTNNQASGNMFVRLGGSAAAAGLGVLVTPGSTVYLKGSISSLSLYNAGSTSTVNGANGAYIYGIQ